MTIEERAAIEYCKIKGLDPLGGTGDWSNNLADAVKMFEELSIKLYCLKRAESTK